MNFLIKFLLFKFKLFYQFIFIINHYNFLKFINCYILIRMITLQLYKKVVNNQLK